MHYEVITQTDDGFEFHPVLTHPEAVRYMELLMESEDAPHHAFTARVYEPHELYEMGGAA